MTCPACTVQCTVYYTNYTKHIPPLFASLVKAYYIFSKFFLILTLEEQQVSDSLHPLAMTSRRMTSPYHTWWKITRLVYIFYIKIKQRFSCLFIPHCTVSNLCIPWNETARPCSQFLPSCSCMRAVYIFPGSVCLFVSSKIGRSILGIHKSLTDTWMWKMEDRTLLFCFWNSKDEQYHFWEYINRNQTFILDSHQPFICSACSVTLFRIRNFAVLIL